jgi:anaerobic magnesium-protoporphyrin IX monomethyl ester cyclase
MLSILVCHSYFLRLDQKQLERAKPYPPLATLQVAAMLRDAGHCVSFFDSMLANGVDDYERALEISAPQMVLFYEDTFNFLSKMCLGTMRRAACQMVASARRAGARVIVAGPDVSDSPAPYLQAGADFALIGEGLSVLLEVLPRLAARVDAPTASLLHGLSGVASRVDGEVVTVSGSRALPASQAATFAAWDLVDMGRYRDVWMQAHGYFSLNMVASRGCSFRCAWCAKPTWGNQYLQRDAVEVATELAFLKRVFAPDHIWFADDIFGFRVDWVAQFAAAVQATDARVPFTIQTRADLVSERMAAALRDAGCREAWLGAESGSQKVLDAMNKGTTVAEIVTARNRLKTSGIRVGFFIQLGYLGEQLDDIMATRDLLHVTRPDEIGVSVSYPLPGTKFHDIVKAQLGAKTRWQQSNDLEMMFRGTYTSDFYRAIRNLLHDQIAVQAAAPNDSQGVAADPQFQLERRWRDLLNDEERYRSAGRETAVAGR